VDLGCKYTLEVGDSGDGLLKVELGWVAFEAGGHETFIPAEAACKTWKQTGPGLPYYLDASEAFQSAVNQFKEDNDNAPLSTLLAEARPRDAMTLWHLLPRVKGQARELVYERMAALTNPPAGVERAGVLALNQPMLDAWWDSWGIDNANWWRRWKGQWPSR
jgi:hypothetical protein